MILGIESSCDETALSLFDPVGFLGEWVRQSDRKPCGLWRGGADLAVSEHLANFPPLLDLVRTQFEMPGKISKIAVTRGPGLIGCLGIGLSVAKSLGLLWGIPVVGVNHLRGHAFSPFIGLGLGEDDDWGDYLPHLGLLVSGGNTLLFSMNEARNIEVLARTVDDAAGEALDKGGKLLGFLIPVAPSLRERQGEGMIGFSFSACFPEQERNEFSFSGSRRACSIPRKMNEKKSRTLCRSLRFLSIGRN